MVRWRSAYILVCGFALGGILLVSSTAAGRDTVEKLQVKIERERNPVKKAKLEIKLARLKLEHAQDAYSKGNVSAGAELLNAYVDDMKSSWQTLLDSGRVASRKPQGFKELEIALREDSRVLEDLEHRIPVFDRKPVERAAGEAEKLHRQVLQALFPTLKSPKRRKHFVNPAGVPGGPV